MLLSLLTERDVADVVTRRRLGSLQLHWRFPVTEENLGRLLVVASALLELLNQSEQRIHNHREMKVKIYHSKYGCR